MFARTSETIPIYLVVFAVRVRCCVLETWNGIERPMKRTFYGKHIYSYHFPVHGCTDVLTLMPFNLILNDFIWWLWARSLRTRTYDICESLSWTRTEWANKFCTENVEYNIYTTQHPNTRHIHVRTTVTLEHNQRISNSGEIRDTYIRYTLARRSFVHME